MKLWIWLACLLTAVHCAVLGIDYGHEYTKGVVVAPGVAFEIVLSQDSKRKDMSGLILKGSSHKDSKKKELERVYGNAAGGLISRFADSAAFYLKSLLGQSIDSEKVKYFTKKLPGTSLVPANNNRNGVSLALHGDNYPVEELIAMNFADLKFRAMEMLKANKVQSNIKGTIITVPAHFTMEQRLALQDAAEIAGLKLIALVNDGVSVAINYASTRQFDQEKQYFIVYDSGAGSTTATLVSIRQGDVARDSNFTSNANTTTKLSTIIEVEGVGYDEELSGHILTHRLRDYLFEQFVNANPSVTESKLSSDAKAMNKLWREAEKVKIVLSANTAVRASVESLYDGIDFKLSITRQEFETLSEDLISSVTQPIKEALKPINGSGSPIDISLIDSIILAGGSTRIPFIKQQLQEFAKNAVTISKSVNADEAAVLGATLRGIGISKIFKSKDIDVIDKTLYDISVDIDGNRTNIFPKGTPVNTIKTVSIPRADNNLVLTVLQENEPIIKYEAGNAKSVISELKNCIDDAIIDAKFIMTHSHTVELQSITGHCTSEEKVTVQKKRSDNTVETSDEVSDDASSNEKSTFDLEKDNQVEESKIEESKAEDSKTEEPKTEESNPNESNPEESKPDESENITTTKTSSRNITFKTKFIGFKPMGASTKQSSYGRLRTLDLADRNRIARDHAQNDLESFYYNARAQVEYNESKLSEINEIGIWLDGEADSASLETLQEKIKEIDAILKRVEEPEPEPTKTKDAGKDMVTPYSAPPNSGEAKNSLTKELNSLANQFENLMGLFDSLGLNKFKNLDIKPEMEESEMEEQKMEEEMAYQSRGGKETSDTIDDTASIVSEMEALKQGRDRGDGYGSSIDELLAKVRSKKEKLNTKSKSETENQFLNNNDSEEHTQSTGVIQHDDL